MLTQARNYDDGLLIEPTPLDSPVYFSHVHMESFRKKLFSLHLIMFSEVS